MGKNLLLADNLNLDIIKLAPNILMVIFYERVVVAGLRAAIVNTNGVNVIRAEFVLQRLERRRDLLL